MEQTELYMVKIGLGAMHSTETQILRFFYCRHTYAKGRIMGIRRANKVAVGNWEILPIDMIEPLKMGLRNTKIIESISPDSEYLVVQGDDEVTTFLVIL